MSDLLDLDELVTETLPVKFRGQQYQISEPSLETYLRYVKRRAELDPQAGEEAACKALVEMLADVTGVIPREDLEKATFRQIITLNARLAAFMTRAAGASNGAPGKGNAGSASP